MNLMRFILIISFLFTADLTWAEPWIANRFSQNCAGCHAPGRLNRKPSKRRCTLSCQGCHVNPNGGGLRNSYGKWTEERWLRSFYTDLAWNKKSTAPLGDQKYYRKHMSDASHGEKGKKGKRKRKNKKHAGLSKKMKLRYAKYGANLEGFKGVVSDEDPYFEASDFSPIKSEVEQLVRIPKTDPYRIERKNMVSVGGDFRLFFLQQSTGSGSPNSKLEQGTFYPMAFDFGVRVRPIKEKLSLVYEGRAFNGRVNDPSSLDSLFGSSGFGITRSAYVLVDDLWYNTYFQYGYYRPMFGLYNPNHNAMITDYTKLGVQTRLKGAGFGAAPNVPFGIFNVLLPTEGATTTDISAEEGFNVTAGLRFVTFGAHLTGTYWVSENNQGVIPTKRLMWNVNAGAIFLNRRLILNGEMTSVRREVAGIDETKILGFEGRYRVWREMYAQVGFAQANAAVALLNQVSGTGISPGSGTETSFGLRAFIISGLEMELMMASKLNKETGFADYKEDTLSWQMHAFF